MTKTIFFKIKRRTARQPETSVVINCTMHRLGWDVHLNYNDGERDWSGRPDMVIAYDIATLSYQFNLTPTKAKALSDIFSDLISSQ